MSKYSLNKQSGKKFCDELWGKLVRLEFENKCAICTSLGTYDEKDLLNPHHLISRRVYKYRWDVQNGLLICPKHHEFDLHISAHTAPWGFEEWVKTHRPAQYAIWVRNRQDLTHEEDYKYEVIYYDLENQYKAKTGDYYMIKRIQMYLLSQHKAQIIMAKKIQGKSISDLAEQYDVTTAMMKKFIEL